MACAHTKSTVLIAATILLLAVQALANENVGIRDYYAGLNGLRPDVKLGDVLKTYVKLSKLEINGEEISPYSVTVNEAKQAFESEEFQSMLKRATGGVSIDLNGEYESD